jgi:hypothetical protein
METEIGRLKITSDTNIENILNAIHDIFKAFWTNDCLDKIRGFRITWEEE